MAGLRSKSKEALRDGGSKALARARAASLTRGRGKRAVDAPESERFTSVGPSQNAPQIQMHTRVI